MLSAVIGAYNEEGRIRDTIKRLRQALSTYSVDAEIIVVDDGSTDRTFDVAKALADKVLRYSANRGFAYALRYGVYHASGSVVMTLPADVRDFTFIPEAMRLVKEYDVVSVSKRHPRSIVIGYGFRRWAIANAYYILIKWVCGRLVSTSDTHYVKVFRSRVLDEVLPFCRLNGAAGETEVLVLARYRQFSVVDIAGIIFHSKRPSSPTFRSIVRNFFDVLRIRTSLERFARSQTAAYATDAHGLCTSSSLD